LGKSESRKYPRLSVHVQVDYTSEQKCFRAQAQTLSAGGLFLTECEELSPGQEITVRFRPAKHLPVIEAKARVCYVAAGQGVAVEFTDIRTEDRARLLRLIHHKRADRRLQPRAPLATQIECERCMSLAFSRDVSMGGMFIETNEPLPVGSSVTVRFNLNYKDKVVTAGAQVAYHVDKMGMGVMFTEIEPHDRDAIREYVNTSAFPLPDPTITSDPE
jgi:c-di-GMP-binding flagellar brake protein YcgR